MQWLPKVKQHALMVMVAVKVNENSAKLSMGTPSQRTDAMKVLATESVLMEGLARAASWPELGKYYGDVAAIYARIIRGERKPGDVLGELKTLEERRKAMMASAIARAEAAKINPRDPALVDLSSRIASKTGGLARMYVWQPQTKKPSEAGRAK